MRIKLIKGKQKELIYKAKGNLSWHALAKKLNISKEYLSGDVQREKILLSDKIYNKLCTLTNLNYDGFIINELDNNWGKINGGRNSTRQYKRDYFSKQF